MEKVVKIKWKGEMKDVTLKEVTWGVVDESMRKSLNGDKCDVLLQKNWQIALSIVGAPKDFPRNPVEWKDFSYLEIGKPLNQGFEELNVLKKKV